MTSSTHYIVTVWTQDRAAYKRVYLVQEDARAAAREVWADKFTRRVRIEKVEQIALWRTREVALSQFDGWTKVDTESENSEN